MRIVRSLELPISPARGEIGCRHGLRQSPKSQQGSADARGRRPARAEESAKDRQLRQPPRNQLTRNTR